MKKPDKYEVEDPDFDQEHHILKNRLGIVDPLELERVEVRALVKATQQAVRHYEVDHCFSSKDVRDLHKLFLEEIFEWAGQYRRVDISSPQIRWCHAPHIPTEMERYSQLLNHFTPFSPVSSRVEIYCKLAQIHGELIVIHPFRDGNGRVTRLLCDLLLGQAQLEMRDPSRFYEQHIREEYHQAIQEVWSRGKYHKLITLYSRLIR